MEPAAACLSAGCHAFPLAEQQGQQGAGPAAAEEAEVAGRLGGHPAHEEDDPAEPQPKGAAALPPGEPRDSLGLESLEPAVDSPGAAEEHGFDRVPRMALPQQEE